MDRLVKALSGVAEEADCAVMLVHHSRKTNGNAVTVDDGRGASAVVAAARSVRTLNTMTKDEAEMAGIEPEMAGIEPEDRRRYFRTDLGKANLVRSAESANWYKIESVELGNGTEEDQRGDSVGVVTSYEYPQLKALDIAPIDIQKAQDAIKGGGPWRADQRATVQPWVGVPIAEALSMDIDDRRVKKQIASVVKKWTKLDLLKEVEKHDKGSRKTHKYIEVGKPAPIVPNPLSYND